MALFWDGDGRAVRFHERPDVREERNPTLATMRLSRTWGTRANGDIRCAQKDKRLGSWREWPTLLDETTKDGHPAKDKSRYLRDDNQKQLRLQLQKSRWSSNRIISSSSARGRGRLRWGR